MTDAVAAALARNFRLRMAAADVRVALAQVERARAEFDPQLFATGRKERIAGETGDFLLSGGVGKKFATGTEIDFEAGQVPTRTGDFRNDYLGNPSSDYAVSVRQPLLRGASLPANLAGVRLANLLGAQATASQMAEVLELLRAAETTYQAAAVAAAVEKALQDSLERTRRMAADAVTRKAAGAASVIDILEAESAVSAARERWVAARKAAQDRLDELWLQMGAGVETRPSFVRIDPLRPPDLPEGRLQPAVHWQRAITEAPAAVLLVNEVQRREVELQRAKNNALPRLDLELGAASASANESGTSDGLDSFALLRITVPWTFRAERAQLEQARAALEKSRAAQDEARGRLRLRIHELCRAIEAGREQLAAATDSTNANRRKWDEQVKRHREGLIAVRDLREAEEELQSAEIREQQARLALAATWAGLTQLDGSIAARHGLSLR